MSLFAATAAWQSAATEFSVTTTDDRLLFRELVGRVIKRIPFADDEVELRGDVRLKGRIALRAEPEVKR